MTVSSPFYSEDHEAFRSVVRQFAKNEIIPNIQEWEQAGEVPRNLYKKAASVGLFGDGFEEAFGGHGQRDAILRMVIMQELAMAGSGGVVASMLSNYIGLPPIQRAGSDEMKKKVLTPCLAGDAVAALAITEPSGGSDVARIQTVAKRDGEEFVRYPKLIELHEKLFKSVPTNLHNSFIDVIVCLRCFYKMTHKKDLCKINKRIGSIYKNSCT